VRRSVTAMLRPGIVLDLLKSFTIYAKDRKHRRIKIISRYQQYEGANLIVRRVIDGYPRKGLLWHF
jgi:type I restriction enzyme, R subunit